MKYLNILLIAFSFLSFNLTFCQEKESNSSEVLIFIDQEIQEISSRFVNLPIREQTIFINHIENSLNFFKAVLRSPKALALNPLLKIQNYCESRMPIYYENLLQKYSENIMKDYEKLRNRTNFNTTKNLIDNEPKLDEINTIYNNSIECLFNYFKNVVIRFKTIVNYNQQLIKSLNSLRTIKSNL